ncbi:MAG: polyprenyl synthetase family protein [Anaerolineales bacterium]|nr:polyprenyl synthetase family protein [Anaerolineales bacterium]
MTLSRLQSEIAPAVERVLKGVLSPLNSPPSEELFQMLSYHLGWSGEGAGPKARGKRVRPLIVALCAGASGGEWQASLPAGAAVELVHNFSLIHDDIEDNSPLRRGRPTIWKLWGVPQAINAGDAMFSLANRTILDLEETASPETALEAAKLLQNTCLDLTRGQFLDLSYETRIDLTPDDYWPMVSGKTAALLRCCTELGGLVAGAGQGRREALRDFGHNLGLAFQVQDDLLGIWGEAGTTGKSVQSDLVEGKKSLPVLFGLSKGGDFAARWAEGPIQAEEVQSAAEQLAAEGAYDFTRARAAELTRKAQQALEQADLQGEHATALRELTDFLLQREM